MSAATIKTPSMTERSFTCPHCKAISHQRWARCLADWLPDDRLPVTGLSSPDIIQIIQDQKISAATKNEATTYAQRLTRGDVFIRYGKVQMTGYQLDNLNVSECFACKKFTLWLHDKVLHPRQLLTPTVNPDMPSDIAHDFEEARSVFDASPRAAAALLRLCVQKLCKVLGEPGNNINNDIASLVRKGLDPRLQKALDAVRVTGNEVVHPGVIDLDDDRDLASSLFTMVNLIVEEMISRPKHVDDVYAKLPQSKRDAIATRDKPKAP